MLVVRARARRCNRFRSQLRARHCCRCASDVVRRGRRGAGARRNDNSAEQTFFPMRGRVQPPTLGSLTSSARRNCCDRVATAAGMRSRDPRRHLCLLAFHVILDNAERARREHSQPESVDTRKRLPPLTLSARSNWRSYTCAPARRARPAGGDAGAARPRHLEPARGDVRASRESLRGRAAPLSAAAFGKPPGIARSSSRSSRK
jgi:hypothetical protein